MPYKMNHRAQRSYNKMIARRNFSVKMTVACFFICANLLLAAIFWPMLMKHLKDIKEGKKKPLIEIKVKK